jgi:hypothetical protein
MTVCYASSISIDAERVLYSGPQGAAWRVALATIRAIGEFRSDSEDSGHCVAFVTDAEGAWFQAPVHATGLDHVLAELGRRLQCALELELASAHPRASQVLWPAVLKGRPLFQIEERGSADSARHALHTDVISHLEQS